MTETVTNAPICKTQICKRPLTYLEDSKCWRCLICNPIPKDIPKPKQEKKFLDVAMTEKRVREILAERVVVSEERIREIVQDELMNWHIPKPPVTASETEQLVAPLKTSSAPETWRQQAKELGIKLFQRKKEDVLAEIAEKTKV